MNKDLIYNGIHIGEHSFVHENILKELETRVVKPGYNFVTIRTGRDQVAPELFYAWAEYLAKNKVYFFFFIQCSTLQKEKTASLPKKW